jgi:diadenosine tetraphosphate (Ap4A) HIT family hydrolase
MAERSAFDVDAYVRRMTTGPCFICASVAGDPAFPHHVVYEDDVSIAFLNKYPTLAGYTLVCPKAHKEQIGAGDLSLKEHLRLQRLVYAVAEAQRRAFAVERVYVMSLGSQQGNRHIHWHVAPLPPGVPPEEQQFAALDVTRRGFLAFGETEMAEIARRIATEVTL